MSFPSSPNSKYSIITYDSESGYFQTNGVSMMPGCGFGFNMRDLIFNQEVDGIMLNAEDYNMCSNDNCWEMCSVLNEQVTKLGTCVCGYKHYCSSSCKEEDSSHTCISSSGVFTVTDEKCRMVTAVNGYNVLSGNFTGLKKTIKKCDKHIRGRFTFELEFKDLRNNTLYGFYEGEFSSMFLKNNGEVICYPNGCGKFYFYTYTTFCAWIHGNPCGNMQLSCGSDRVIHGVFDKGMDQISIVDGKESKFYALSSVLNLASTSITPESLLKEWSKSDECICIDIEDTMSPVIMPSKKVSKMSVEKIIYTQVVDTILFRVSVVSDKNGKRFVTCGVKRIGKCVIHGKVFPGTHCPILKSDEIDIESNFECTCPKPKEKSTHGYIMEKTLPVGIPPMRHVSGFKRASPCNNVGKSRKIPGISKRDMSINHEYYTSLNEALNGGGWKLKSQKNHLKYVNSIGKTYVCSKTPSTKNWEKKAKSSLKRAS